MARYDSILETIGHTPVVRLVGLAPPSVDLFAKVEAFNPMGSVKDRMALGIIQDAERSGALQPGQTVVEATSGNTGIGLAMVCARTGHPLVIVMAENFSVERRRLMRFLGAKVVLTPAALKGTGMLAKARELADAHGWFLTRQFDNEANADVHSHTTAREILDDFAGERLDYWVTGFGTGGTLKGVARVLRRERPETRIVVCEPDNSPLLGSGIAQPRSDDGEPSASHPRFRPHLMQGWSPDFIARLAEDAVRDGLVDRVLGVSGDDALRCSRALAEREGILTGISGGATLAGAIAVARDAPAGSVILCMLPDTGERYLSTPLFAEISADMSEEEEKIARSTPNYRFDVTAPPVSMQGDEVFPVTAEAEAFIDEVTRDPAHPVILFALEWCEFCWSVRRMFAAFRIPYRSIDLDSVAYQEDDRGGRIRAALTRRTSFATIPQIFVGGEFVGGATDAFDAWRSGRLQDALRASGVAFDASVDQDPYSFLPTWLHPR